MSSPGLSIDTQSQARGCIYECLAADDPRTAVEELVGDIDTADDPDILKVAEYALLKTPINEGVRSYLESPFRYSEGAESSDPQVLYANVSHRTTSFASAALAQDRNRDLAEKINRRRAAVLQARGQEADGVTGIFDKLGPAALSAAITTYAVALVNGYEIADTTDLLERDRQKFIAAVKSSGQLLRSLTRLHLNQIAVANTIVTQHGMAIQEGNKHRSINKDGLATRADGSVRLAKPLKDWRRPVGGMMNRETREITMVALGTLGDHHVRDVPIGCLLSFDPELATGYYQDYVDLMEMYGAWPADLRIS